MAETRKLATILALDMAGYSRAAEADDTIAAEKIRLLRSTIDAVGQASGGRVFNSAGDGFMLEFPTATSGLQAAVEILTQCGDPERALPKVRMGLHVGEVIVEPNGDLLGHGVNIAARLQQLARPAGLIVSEDIRRSVRGPLAEKLEPMGVVQLNKMHERMDIYGLAIEGTRAKLPAFLRRRRRLLTGLAAGLVLAAAMLMAGQVYSRLAVPPTRFAIAPIGAPADDAELVAFSRAMGAEISNTATLQALNTVLLPSTTERSEAETLRHATDAGARYALVGAARRYQGTIHLDVRLLRANDGALIWSRTFDEADDRLPILPVMVSVRVAAVLSCMESAGHRPRSTPQDALTLLANLCGADSYEDPFEHYHAMQRAAERAPNSPAILAAYAFMTAYAYERGSVSSSSELRDAGVAAAQRAIALDPRQPYAYAALEALEGFGVRWRERERWLQRGLQHSPNSAALLWTYGGLLRETGRFEEAQEKLARAVAIEPWAENASANMVWTLGLLGRRHDARAELDRIEPMWPDIRRFRYERFRLELFGGDEGRARAAFASYAEGRPEERMRCWQALVDSVYPVAAAARAEHVRSIVSCVEAGAIGADLAIQALAHINEVERAFTMLSTYRASEQFWPGIVFVPAAASLRRDARFAQIIHETGIMDFWRESGWPDFCDEPGLTIECR